MALQRQSSLASLIDFMDYIKTIMSHTIAELGSHQAIYLLSYYLRSINAHLLAQYCPF